MCERDQLKSSLFDVCSNGQGRIEKLERAQVPLTSKYYVPLTDDEFMYRINVQLSLVLFRITPYRKITWKDNFLTWDM